LVICKKCNNQFKTYAGLVSHLSNPKGKCKTNIKEYYDLFLRKPDEGFCKFCGRETGFAGIVKGYPSKVCKYCKSKDPETKRKKRETHLKKKDYYLKKWEDEKIESGYYNYPEVCEMCKKQDIESRFETRSGLARHIWQIHKIKPREYYDIYFKKDKEGICPITGHQTRFKSLREGYYIFYGSGTGPKDPRIRSKIVKSFKESGKSYLDYFNMSSRIKTYQETCKKRRELQFQRWRFVSLIRKLTIKQDDKLQCQICGVKFEKYISISIHIFKFHKIFIKKYYDEYFKKDGEGICPISKLETNFDSLERGYFKYHLSAVTHSLEVKNGAKKSQLHYIHKKIRKEQGKYNVEFVNLDNLNFIGDFTEIKCLKCNQIYKNRFSNLQLGFGKCPRCFPRNTHTSKSEKEIADYIKSIIPQGEEILTSYTGLIKNPKTGRPLELDIYIPSKKIAFEFNGLYWHSELNLENPEKYHILKTELCKKEGVQLIHIFEDEWFYKKEIIKNMIKYKLHFSNNSKIFARKCIIKEIDPKIKNEFLDQNHIQGKDYSRIKLGAFYKDELVSVMTFSLGNISRGGNPKDKECWELTRFCSFSKYNVIGTAGKLLKYFERNYKWREIYSYADLRISTGDIYYKLGFEFSHQTKPDYFYVNEMKRIYRFNLRKTKDEPKDIPEWKLRNEQGYYRIWDCGKIKFIKQKNN